MDSKIMVMITCFSFLITSCSTARVNQEAKNNLLKYSICKCLYYSSDIGNEGSAYSYLQKGNLSPTQYNFTDSLVRKYLKKNKLKSFDKRKSLAIANCIKMSETKYFKKQLIEIIKTPLDSINE